MGNLLAMGSVGPVGQWTMAWAMRRAMGQAAGGAMTLTAVATQLSAIRPAGTSTSVSAGASLGVLLTSVQSIVGLPWSPVPLACIGQ